MRVLVACECSGIVRNAFIRRGHDAWSCDIKPSELAGPHIQGDVMTVLDQGWDLMIAHPPCTYLCSMGVWWNHKRPERWSLTDAGQSFFMNMINANVPRIAVENPVGIMSTRYRRPDQIVNPWQFGQEFTKPTCLWLKNLPKLIPTKIVGRGDFYTKANGSRMSKWSHITSGTRKSERATIASRTFTGIAEAMAEQWGGVTLRKTGS